SIARLTRTWTREDLSPSASPFMKSFSRAMSGGGAAPGLSLHRSSAPRAGPPELRISTAADRTTARRGGTRINDPPGSRCWRPLKAAIQYTAWGKAGARERRREIASALGARHAPISHAHRRARRRSGRPSDDGGWAERRNHHPSQVARAIVRG